MDKNSAALEWLGGRVIVAYGDEYVVQTLFHPKIFMGGAKGFGYVLIIKGRIRVVAPTAVWGDDTCG